MLELPSGVNAVKSKGRHYYYWHPNRNTSLAGKPVALGSDPRDPEFWKALRQAQGFANGVRPGTFAALIAEYKGSEAWRDLRFRTQEHYTHQLERIQAAWGDLPVEGLTVAGIYGIRKQYEKTPVAANHLVSAIRTLLKWGLEHGYGKINPAREINPLRIRDEQNAKPWPEQAYQFMLEHAPEDLRRATFLGRATGQRRSDLVLMGKRHRVNDGIAFQIGKLRDKPHFIPLTRAQLLEVDSWSCSDLGPWIISPIGRSMDGDGLQSALGRFIAKSPELRGLKLRWHGLRAMAVCDRRLSGATHGEIAKNLGMSPGMVERYSRHIDQVEVARKVRDRLERPTNGIAKRHAK